MEKGKQPQIKKQEPKKAEIKKSIFKFDSLNNKLILTGIGFLGLGFILLIGGGSDDPKVFNPAMFNFQRMTVAPILLATGYLIEIVAIMIVPKEKKTD
jgi:hypothetical protein